MKRKHSDVEGGTSAGGQHPEYLVKNQSYTERLTELEVKKAMLNDKLNELGTKMYQLVEERLNVKTELRDVEHEIQLNITACEDNIKEEKKKRKIEISGSVDNGDNGGIRRWASVSIARFLSKFREHLLTTQQRDVGELIENRK